MGSGPEQVHARPPAKVIDGSFNPYHWNFLASRMPQHLDDDAGNDLPLDQSPDTWLPGFPAADSFASYQPLALTLEEENANQREATLRTRDADVWASMAQSTADAVHYNWIPNTKFIGAVHYGSRAFQGSNSAHGAGTSAVSVGNFHGTCPECLLVA